MTPAQVRLARRHDAQIVRWNRLEADLQKALASGDYETLFWLRRRVTYLQRALLQFSARFQAIQTNREEAP